MFCFFFLNFPRRHCFAVISSDTGKSLSLRIAPSSCDCIVTSGNFRFKDICKLLCHVDLSLSWGPHPTRTTRTVTLQRCERLNPTWCLPGLGAWRACKPRGKWTNLRPFDLRHKSRFACWNIQTLLRIGYATLLSCKLCNYNVALAGLCESRCRGTGQTIAGDHLFLWSGPDDLRDLCGVALAIPLH